MNRHCTDDMDISIHYNFKDKTLEVNCINKSATYVGVDTYDRIMECINDFIEEYAIGV